MSHRLPFALLLIFVSCPLAFGQRPRSLSPDFSPAAPGLTFEAIVHGQAPKAIPVDYRRNTELLEIPEYRDLLDELEAAQAELTRLRENLSASGIEDHGDHFYFANYDNDRLSAGHASATERHLEADQSTRVPTFRRHPS